MKSRQSYMNTKVNCKPIENQHLSNIDDHNITIVVKWKDKGRIRYYIFVRSCAKISLKELRRFMNNPRG